MKENERLIQIQHDEIWLDYFKAARALFDERLPEQLKESSYAKKIYSIFDKALSMHQKNLDKLKK